MGRTGSFDPVQWALVDRTADAMAFVRRVVRFADVIARREVPLRIHFRWIRGAWVEPLRRADVGPTIDPCEWATRRCGRWWRTGFAFAR